MIAVIQRLAVLSVVFCAILIALLGSSGQFVARLFGILMIAMLAGAILLGAEMLLSAVHSRGGSTQRPTWVQWASACVTEYVTAAQVFAWRQPFQANAIPDDHTPPIKPTRGLVLVHGYFCNRALWVPWQHRLKQKGVPCAAITLEPAFGSIDDYACLIEQAVQAMRSATGLSPVIVAHSMGGLAVRSWLAQNAAIERVHRVITIGTPHQGTWLARFAQSRNGRQMRQRGDWLNSLFAQEEPGAHANFTCFYGHCDNIVFPTETAMLNGADNRHLSGVAHMRMVFTQEVFDEACRWATDGVH